MEADPRKQPRRLVVVPHGRGRLCFNARVREFVGALDQGTTSTRFLVFDAAGREVARRQLEHRQILQRPGWVEHDPIEIAARVDETIAGGLRAAGLTGRDLAAIGITNQRETTVVWHPRTGLPWYNAIVWQDTRTDDAVAARFTLMLGKLGNVRTTSMKAFPEEAYRQIINSLNRQLLQWIASPGSKRNTVASSAERKAAGIPTPGR